nr:hypothetical protein Iba_chr06bCG0230 [Ipomoea batatas]
MVKVKLVVKSANSPESLSHRCNGSTYVARPALFLINSNSGSFGVSWMPWSVIDAFPSSLMRTFASPGPILGRSNESEHTKEASRRNRKGKIFKNVHREAAAMVWNIELGLRIGLMRPEQIMVLICKDLTFRQVRRLASPSFTLTIFWPASWRINDVDWYPQNVEEPVDTEDEVKCVLLLELVQMAKPSRTTKTKTPILNPITSPFLLLFSSGMMTVWLVGAAGLEGLGAGGAETLSDLSGVDSNCHELTVFFSKSHPVAPEKPMLTNSGKKKANPSAKLVLPSESMLKVKRVVKSAKSPVALSHSTELRSYGVSWIPWVVMDASPSTLMRTLPSEGVIRERLNERECTKEGSTRRRKAQMLKNLHRPAAAAMDIAS